MDTKRAFQLSAEMMYGQKWNAFVLDLSFILWLILGAITCGLVNVFLCTLHGCHKCGTLWSAPRGRTAQGYLNTYELPGFETESK